MKLLIVESPNKVKKIAAILGDGWTVMASSGHIRDLPRQELGLDLKSFALTYEFVPRAPIPGTAGKFYPGGADRVKRLTEAVRSAEMVYLATDPDREGEAISWHLKETLGLHDRHYRRITFDAITPKVIEAAMAKARTIDNKLVKAQEARRALDRLVGWMVSPILRDSIGPKASAGRVQSPAVRLVVERERQIRAFKEVRHFGASLSFDQGAWSAAWVTKPHLAPGMAYILDEGLARKAASARVLRVIEADVSEKREAPPPPFSTSLLLQAASVTLKLNPEITAKLAQKLFEQGLITYHRTDSVNFSEEALTEIRAYSTTKGLALPDQPRRFKSKGDAQEAHEAIRPTHCDQEVLSEDEQQRALYRLIRQRAVASQLADAVYNVTSLKLRALDVTGFAYEARGQLMKEPGWRSLTADDSAEDPDGDPREENEGGRVPALEIGTEIRAADGKVVAKKTKPAPRYTQATLIKKLETEGIGRPSTYPSILGNILNRNYLLETKRFLTPTMAGETLVDALVRSKFSFIDLPFTRAMETHLDEIAEGTRSYLDVVRREYGRLESEIARHTPGPLAHPCPACGKALRRNKGKKGVFWGCSGYRDGCKFTADDDKGKPLKRSRA